MENQIYVIGQTYGYLRIVAKLRDKKCHDVFSIGFGVTEIEAPCINSRRTNLR